MLRRTGTAVLAGALLFAGGVLTATLIGSNGPAASAGAPFVPADFGRAVFLSHINNPRTTPGFPGDPAFRTSVPFTVPRDGFYLQ